MTKNYISKKSKIILEPSSKTIQFLLSYSKALRIIKTDRFPVEFFKN
ncbi:hypothetical protein N9J39_00605 [Flavicella sp.]|nr:hypothetical protein [Flavicella sp.]MDA9111356.1 hypothetical protein [Flavicella sp.]|tara:strand:+ start:20591 stop:20731 length:141 start_codon:yes stop_codon:yes gene_type:complete